MHGRLRVLPSHYLIALDTKDIEPQEEVQTTNIGKIQYDSFIKERLITRSEPVSEPIRENKQTGLLHRAWGHGRKCHQSETALRDDSSLLWSCILLVRQ